MEHVLEHVLEQAILLEAKRGYFEAILEALEAILEVLEVKMEAIFNISLMGIIKMQMIRQ